ncbi:MAG: AlpA family phage regulatory protein [Methylovulum sp.]|nr:AlpA family phage regulatory protein [Methylovulum sp.]MCF7998487.1 AlpA family phage regulatory protein [Methylovulum sp.]
MSEKRLIRLQEVLHLTGLSRSGIYRGMDSGIFPKQIKIGDKAVAWSYEQVHAWLDEKLKLAA